MASAGSTKGRARQIGGQSKNLAAGHGLEGNKPFSMGKRSREKKQKRGQASRYARQDEAALTKGTWETKKPVRCHWFSSGGGKKGRRSMGSFVASLGGGSVSQKKKNKSL